MFFPVLIKNFEDIQVHVGYMLSYMGNQGNKILICTNRSLMGRWAVNDTIDGTGLGQVMGRCIILKIYMIAKPNKPFNERK